MAVDRRICCSIMVCQMIAILSGVSLMYLSVIIVIPSKNELNYKFHDDPIMCTTVRAEDIMAGGKKGNCSWSTCGEWCLSKASTPCWQIITMPRMRGSHVDLQNCQILSETNCSAINVTKTVEKLCRKGECQDLSGLYNCSKYDENPCREISAAYRCPLGKLNKTSVSCNEEKCSNRLKGIYRCDKGQCNRLDGISSYLDCERKCEDLDLKQGNVIVFSSEYILNAQCSASFSNNQNEINDLNTDQEWKNQNEVLLVFCTYSAKVPGKDNLHDLNMDDCFNATLRDSKMVGAIRSYLQLIRFRDNVPPNIDWIIPPEETLRILPDTMLKINSDGCVNTLMKECRAFFETHATDHRDGRTPDRYPCFYTNSTSDFVVGNYNPILAYRLIMIASVLPACLFVVSCFCLFFCSKMVGVDEAGTLRVTLLNKKKGASGGGGGSASEL